LILVCRSQEKGEKAMEEIRATKGFDPEKTSLELWLIDLANFASVLAFGDRFERDGGNIDILVANAAVFWPDYHSTVDNWEETLQVNHLSTALMCILLLPRLQAASKGSIPRVVIVGSVLHFMSTFGPEVMSKSNMFEKLSEKTEDFDSRKRYSDSKLLSLFFARALASHLTRSRIVVNCVCPGYCTSGLRRNISISAYTPGLVEHTTEEGSRQLVWAAIGGQGHEEELNGAFINLSGIREPSDFAIGEEGKHVQVRVWADTMKILFPLSPKVGRIIESL